MTDILRIVTATFSTAAFAALLGLGLAIAARKFRVQKDKKVQAIEDALPGLNCGVCGYAGCATYAEVLASGEEEDGEKCTPGGSETLEALSALLGVTPSGTVTPMVARLACAGGNGIAKKDFLYQGYADCEAAWLHFEGDKGCKYGCLGLGSCVKVCPVDAIDYTDNGLVKVDEKKCISCELCATICPTGVMKMIPADAQWFVACNSRDKAKLTKSLCSVGCIGCRICEKKFPESGFKVADNLSQFVYNEEEGTGQDGAESACPPKCIIKIKD